MKHDSATRDFELHSLRNLLGVPASGFPFLTKLSAEELVLLKNQVYTSMQNGQREIYGTIAKVSKYMPNFLNAKVSQDILGPHITANLSYFLPAKEAISIASHFSTSFFSDVIELLVPEKISEMISLTPFEQMRKAVNELINRGNFFVIGSLIDYTPIDSVDKMARGMANPEHLIHVTFNCRDKSRVLKLFQAFGENRIYEVITAGLGESLYSEMKTIYEHADDSLIQITRKTIQERSPEMLTKYETMVKR